VAATRRPDRSASITPACWLPTNQRNRAPSGRYPRRRERAARKRGRGSLKKDLSEHYWNYFAPYRAKRAELAANLDYVDTVLREGAARARAVAEKTLARARKNCGLR
jgi:hypothetical protein